MLFWPATLKSLNTTEWQQTQEKTTATNLTISLRSVQRTLARPFVLPNLLRRARPSEIRKNTQKLANGHPVAIGNLSPRDRRVRLSAFGRAATVGFMQFVSLKPATCEQDGCVLFR